MPTLFGATEPEGFSVGGTGNTVSPAVTTDTQHFDTRFSRCAIQIPTTHTFLAYDIGGLPEIWFRFRYGNNGMEPSGGGTDIIRIMNAALQPIVRIVVVSGGWRMDYWNGSAYVNGTAVLAAVNGQLIDIHVKINSTTGIFEWFVAGNLMDQPLVGNTDLFSASISFISFRSPAAVARPASEFIVRDEPTVGCRLLTMSANGNGANTDWSGSYVDIDETTVNDADFISSNTNDDVETFTLTDPASPALDKYSVESVIVSSRASVAPTGPQNIQSALRVGGTDYFSANMPGLTSSFKNGFQAIWDQNPNTATDWLITDLAAIESGLKSIA